MIVPHQYDVIIVGAGLVGGALACALAQKESTQHLRLAVIEAGGAPELYSGNEFDPRVVALTQASQQLLEQIGIWKQIANTRVCPYQEMHVWDAEGTGAIHFDCREVAQPCLGHIVENSLISSELLKKN